MKKEHYSVYEIHKLGLLMGRKGPLKTKVEVLRLVRKLKHRTVIRNGQKTYQVPLIEILEYNKRISKTVSIPLLSDSEIHSGKVE